jgi:hypothetical protein
MLTFNDEYIPTKIRKAITGTKYQKSVDDILKKIKLKTLPGVEMLG